MRRLPHDGRLILVVGPSGAGKDALISAARKTLSEDDRFVFARRVITRASDPQGENHIAVSLAEFEQAAERSEFGLMWRAHDIAYAIPQGTLASIGQSKFVVANVSRTVIHQARLAYHPVTVVWVTASRQVRAERLFGRGRESVTAIESRLERAPVSHPQPDEFVISNNGSLRAAVEQFMDALFGIATAA